MTQLLLVPIALIGLLAGALLTPVPQQQEQIFGATPALTVTQGGTGTSTHAVSQLLYGAGTSTIKNVPTTTLTASLPLALSNTVAKVGGSNSVLSLDTSGAWSGTAGSLAANGGNCSAGSFPLGVDALGAVETCTDAWTEAENTAADYEQALTAGDALTRTGDDFDFDGGATPAGDLGNTWADPSVDNDSHDHTGATISGLDISDDTDLTAGDGLTLTDDDLDCDTADTNTFGCLTAVDWDTFNDSVDPSRTLTVAGTASQITSSAGAQDLSANRTWTLSLPSHVIFPGNFQATNATTTNATTTSLYVGSLTGPLQAISGQVSASTSLANVYVEDALTISSSGSVAWTALTSYPTGCTNQFVRSIDDTLTCASVNNADWSGTDLSVANGGTGVSTFTSSQLLYGNGTAALSSTATTTLSGTSKQISLSNSPAVIGSSGAVLSLPTYVLFPGDIAATNATTTNATTTGTHYVTGAFASTTLLFAHGLTSCTGENMLTWSAGRFGCAADDNSGVGGGGSDDWTFASNLLGIYPATTTNDVWFGSSATATAPFWFDVSATTTYIGNGGTGDSTFQFGPSSNEWSIGYDDTDKSFALASSTTLGTTNALTITKTLNVGIGTSTPRWPLQLANTTGPQLTLSDGSLGSAHWSIRNINSNLYFASSSPSTFATSTRFAFHITPGGQVSAGESDYATSTSMVIDWATTPNQVLTRIGTAAITIGFNNASTSGMTKRLVICNGGGTASTVTFSGADILWTGGTAPTHTTTANKCDILSFLVTQATSTSAGTTKVLGASTLNF